jgi:sensor histidine kinase YesM
LVENAVKHGIAPREEGGAIEIKATGQGGILYLCVTNPGKLNTMTSTTGLGLKNARARLALLFGSEANLLLTQRTEDLFAAEVFLPQTKQSLSV